jgi:hypothetical protein
MAVGVEVKILTESYGNRIDNMEPLKPEYFGVESMRDMRSVDDQSYSRESDDESQTQEDTDEGWQPEKKSPLAGKMSGTMEELERIQSSNNNVSDEVRECIQDSLDCYQACTETIVKCLVIGGAHAENEHINLLTDCARICNTNADFMLRNSTYHPQTCGITADICDECADTCDRFEDDFMKECASVCRRCAESCREMAR